MLTVEQAYERILEFFHVLELEEKPLLDAVGQVLAREAVSPLNIPPLANSALDGYAVQAASVRGASPRSPVVLKVVGSVAAGELPRDTVGPGTAVRIMTGAPVPPGADAIVGFEDTNETDRKRNGKGGMDEVAIRVSVEAGNALRPAGQDVTKGERVLEAGRPLRAAEVGVLASMGFGKVKVFRRPAVSILATGDELVQPGEPCPPGKIYNINSFSIAAAVHNAGGIPKLLGIARDNLESLQLKIGQGLDADMLITTAGVSKGDYDIVKDVLAQRGKIELWSVRMRPAKPLAFGILHGPQGRQVPHLGLPGNPVSALVAFEQFGGPAIRKMLGYKQIQRPVIEAVLEDPIHNTDGRRVYARVLVTKRNGAYYAKLTGHQSSNLLTSVARANGLAICPEDLPVKKAGEVVKVQMLDWPAEVF
jgi:molybdopterin molybdotransferase